MLFFTVTRFPASVHIIDVDTSAEKKKSEEEGFTQRGTLTKLHHSPVTTVSVILLLQCDYYNWGHFSRQSWLIVRKKNSKLLEALKI